MKSSVQIISLKQIKINKKTYRRKQNIFVYLSIICIFSVLLSFSLGGEDVKQVGSSMGYVYNPVNSLYNDNSSIIFTSVDVLNKEKLNFSLPVVSNNIVNENGTIKIGITNSIMIKSIEAGVVEEIGTTLDGIKYIKIRHCFNVYSIIENVQIIGVAEKIVVKKGQDIATAAEGDTIVLKIFNEDSQIKSLKINESRIIWEK